VRVAIVSNSQGTAAGVAHGRHYPALVRDALAGEHELHFLVVSGWSIGDFNLHIDTLVDARPDLVVVQIGIVEAARRILSTAEKRVLRKLGRAGQKLTKLLHDRRQSVIRTRRRLRIDARMYTPERFDRELGAFLATLRNAGADVLLFEIPPFSSEYERLWYPHISDDLATFNDVLRRHGAVPLLPPDADTFAIWQPGTVHFTPEGHRLVADRVTSLVRVRAGAAV
jgi:hypothetical protein